METQCTQEQMTFQQLARREEIRRFDGGKISLMRVDCFCEKYDLRGKDRVRKRDRGKAIAGKSTLNRS
jgi:hypothetical protein